VTDSEPPELTVVSLCRDNPEALAITLVAMVRSATGLRQSWEILVLDGSEGDACRQVVERLRPLLEAVPALNVRYHQLAPRGIYAAMNVALVLARGQALAFMHAGDHYLPGGLTRLVEHWQALRQPAAVFGQAWIQPPHGKGWLTPPDTVHRLQRWLRWMVPCHQSFLFEIGFARAHPYALGSLLADRAVMRAALRQSESSIYLRLPVCVYGLEGASSRLPALDDLMIRLLDPQRRAAERLAELLKLLLRPWAPAYPHLMRFRATVLGLLCAL